MPKNITVWGEKICYPSEFNYTVLCIYPATRQHNPSVVLIFSQLYNIIPSHNS